MSGRTLFSAMAPDEAARWSDLAARSGFVDFLSPEDGFRTCVRSGRPWTNKDRPGIYFWLAEDGEAYIGQSVTPRSRLRQHVRDHGDVMLACFRPCAQSDLDRVEEELINQLGGHFPLRNIKLAVATSRDVPFDELVDAEERESFIAGGEVTDGDWQDLELLTRLQTAKFIKFLAHDGAREVLAAARLFISRAIPNPAATEASFWSITLFPRTCFIRINAGQQEVFTCEGRAGESKVRILTDERVSLLRSRKAPYRVPSYVTTVSASAMEEWLTADVLESCRRLVVRLMRHTTTLNSGSHCPQAVRFDAETD